MRFNRDILITCYVSCFALCGVAAIASASETTPTNRPRTTRPAPTKRVQALVGRAKSVVNRRANGPRNGAPRTTLFPTDYGNPAGVHAGAQLMTTDQILPSGWRFVRGSTASGELHPSAGGIGRVLAHTRNSSRARWGVWHVGTAEETLGLLDEAIERIQDGVPGLITRERQVTEVERRGGAVSAAEYRVPMNKPVGTLGGSEGDGRALEHVAVLVTREASGAVNITTAYPIEPPAASARDRRVDAAADAALDDDRDPPRGLMGRGAPAPSSVRYRGTRAVRTTRNGWRFLAANAPNVADPSTLPHPAEGAIERVLAHKSDTNRADWGVWGSGRAQLSDDGIFALIDEAVDAIAAQSPAATPAGMWPADAAGRANGISAKISYTVHMGRSVGTAGGSRGRGKALTAIKVSLLAHDDGTVSIVTAYPVRGDGADVSHEDTVLNGRAP